MTGAHDQSVDIPLGKTGNVQQRNVNKEPCYVDNGGERDEDCNEMGQVYLSN